MKTITDICYNRKDVFEIVTEFPRNYVLWNIGRRNFPHPGFIPLAEPTKECNYYIKLNTLKALKLDDEDLCLYLIHMGHRRRITRETFLQLIEEYKAKSAA